MDKNRIGIIAMLLMAALSFGYYHMFLKDDLSTFSALKVKKTSVQDAIARNNIILETQKSRIENVKYLEKEMDDQKLFFLDGDRVPFFLNYISSLAHRNGVVIRTIEPGQTESGDLLTKTTFNAEIKGKFPHIYKFLYHLEEDWKVVKIETLSIEKNPEDSSVNVRLTLAVLLLNGVTENT